jgi:hypothetical protein
VFAGLEPSYGNHEEKNMMETLWKHYQNEEVIEDFNELDYILELFSTSF